MVKATKKGYLVITSGYNEHYQAMVQGCVDGRKVLVYYSAEWPRGLNLDEPLDDSPESFAHYTTMAEAVERYADAMYGNYQENGYAKTIRVLAKGRVIL